MHLFLKQIPKKVPTLNNRYQRFNNHDISNLKNL